MANNWPRKPLSHLTENGSPITYGVVKPGAEGAVRFVRGGDITGGRVSVDELRTITEDVSTQYRRTLLQGGELLVSLVGNPGQVALAPSSLAGANIARQVGLVRLGQCVDANFVKYFLLSPEGQRSLGAYSIGSVQQVINLRDLKTVKVPFPAMPIQRRIADVLGKLDDKIELNRRMNRTLEKMAAAIFKSWFIDFDPVHAKAEGRSPNLLAEIADLFPDTFEDSDLGPIPKGWTVGRLIDVLEELETGGRPRGGVSKYKTGVPSIGAESIVGLGIFDYSKTKYVPHDFFYGMKKGHLKSWDVLLYKDGGRPGQFEPHVTLFGNGFPFHECAINEHVYRMQSKPDIGQSFLFFWLSSNLAMDEMRVKGTGVAIPGLNSTQVKSLTTLMPPREITAL